jgi:hypothetical protein
MDKFSQFINNIPEEAGNPVVKIAILDDGVNAHMGRFLYTDIGGAISFHTRGGLEHDSEKVFTHHFPSTTGHGAEMAERVLQVFPKAKLYVARLNVCEEDGNTAITAYSAAEVGIHLYSL